MILPDMLLDHARRLAGSDASQTADVDLRRGVSAAYYAVFHDLTDRAARHLIGSLPEAERNKIRRPWSHGEFAAAAAVVAERARNVAANSARPLSKEARTGGPLVDIAAADSDLVAALQLFGELQEQRQLAASGGCRDDRSTNRRRNRAASCQPRRTGLTRSMP